MHLFSEISIILVFTAAVSILMRALRQPLIIGYILAGLIVGPSLLGFVQSPETVSLLGEFGIALLLFTVGLGLNPKVIKEVGRVAVFTGIGQIMFTVFFATILTRALGYSGVESLYMSVGLAFSSTIIILKLLSDKKEQNKLYGKISIGFLLVQDIVATIALVAASAAGTGNLDASTLGGLAVKGILLGVAVFAVAKIVLQPMSRFLSRSQELLFLFAIAWGFGIGTLFYEFGFSLEIGALLAGVALASLPYAQEVASRLRPLRDFFLIVFFIALGSRLNLGNFTDYIGPVIALSALVTVGNPLIVMSIMGLLGYTKKISFKTSLAVAQISEFSLIFLLLGQKNGHISEEIVSILTLVALVTIAISSYMIIYSDQLYSLFERYLTLFERRKVKKIKETKSNYDAVLFGYNRGGNDFINVFKKITKRYIVVDYDPDAIDELERKHIRYLYGDATDLELLEEINLDQVRLVVSVMTDKRTNTFLLNHLENINPNVVFICTADSYEQAAELYGLGASYVMMPHYIGSEKISSFILKSGLKKTEFKKYRKKHIDYIHTHFEPDNDE